MPNTHKRPKEFYLEKFEASKYQYVAENQIVNSRVNQHEHWLTEAEKLHRVRAQFLLFAVRNPQNVGLEEGQHKELRELKKFYSTELKK